MNRDRAKKLLPLIQAYAEGKVIQRYSPAVADWVDTEEPSFNDGFDYRIKPGPREYWICLNEVDGKRVVYEYDDPSASYDCTPYKHVVHVREVLDDSNDR